MNNSCFLCNAEFNDTNRTVEHIIPMAFGGRITSSLLICRDCNSTLGHTIDSNLYKQLAKISELAGPFGRNKSKKLFIQGFDKDGKEKRVLQGLKSPYVLKMYDQKSDNIINLYTTSEEEVRKLAKKKKKEVEEKGGQVLADIDNLKIEEGESNQQMYFGNIGENGKNGFKFGGNELFYGFLKIAIEYYLKEGFDINYINDSIEHLKGNKSMFKKYGIFYYPETLPNIERETGIFNQLYHLLYLKIDKASQCIYCYIDLFGIIKVICLLSSDHNLDDERRLYFFNLNTNVEEAIDFSINPTASLLTSIPFAKTNYEGLADEYLARFFENVESKQKKSE